MIQIDQKGLHSANIQVGFLVMRVSMLDVATAATAVRNLNGYDLGSRQLRVDFSEKEGLKKDKEQPSNLEVIHFSRRNSYQ